MIKGLIEGETEASGKITVERGGKVVGPLKAGEVAIHGTVEGNIQALNSLHLAPGGRIVGNVKTPHIRVEDGGVLQGAVLTESTPRPTTAKPVGEQGAP